MARTEAVIVRVCDADLQRAVAVVLLDAGWRIGPSDLTIADQSPADVLLVPPLALACREAADAVADGAVQGALATDHLEALGSVLRAVRSGCAVVGRSIHRLAAPLALLSERQIDVLAGATLGYTNREIAAEIHASIPSVKRDLAVIGQRLGTTSRSSLIATGHRLGFPYAPLLRREQRNDPA